MKNLLNHIFQFEFMKRTHLMGFSWRTGLLLIFSGGGATAALMIGILSEVLAWIEVFSFASILIILFSFLFMFVGLGYRISVSDTHFVLRESFLGIPYQGFKVELEHIHFIEHLGLKDEEGFQEDHVYIYMQDDPWQEMGFSDWVEIVYQGKSYAIGNNDNFDRLYEMMKGVVGSRLKHQS